MDTPQEVTAQKSGYRTLGIVALLCIVALMGWLSYYNLHTEASPDQTLREQFIWRFADAAPLPQMSRRTTVTLKIAGVELPAGTYPGNCNLIDGAEIQFLPDELSGVLCRAGDMGTEIGIFRENEELILKRSSIVGAEGRGGHFVSITKEQVQ